MRAIWEKIKGENISWEEGKEIRKGIIGGESFKKKWEEWEGI